MKKSTRNIVVSRLIPTKKGSFLKYRMLPFFLYWVFGMNIAISGGSFFQKAKFK